MQVTALIVIVFVHGFADDIPYEERTAARGLYDKHVNRGTGGGGPDKAWLFEIRSDVPIEKGEALVLDTNYKIVARMTQELPGVITTDNVGVYLVFHAKQSSDPVVFGVTNLGKSPAKSVQAERVVDLLVKLGIPSIRKLSLVACHGTNDKTGGSKNFLVAVANELANRFDKKHLPMIAGYDDYVSAGADGHRPAARRKTSRGLLLPSGFGSIGRRNSLGKGTWGPDLVAAGWSDKQQLPTNTGVTAIVH